jgi:RNA polymerase sigma-70 factor (ECF subfamily)
MVDAARMSVPPEPACLTLEEWIEAHGDRLLRSACHLCGNETEAQDLVQETYVQAVKSMHRFRGDSTIYTWLHGILRNLCRRHLRQQKRLVFEEELVLKQPAHLGSTEDLDREFCARGLTAAVQKLSPEHREVIVLRYYENLKLDEIARQTGVSKGTVKSRLHYAVRGLEQLVPKEMNLFSSRGASVWGAVVLCVLLLLVGNYFPAHFAKNSAAVALNVCVIDVPLQTERHVNFQQGNMIVDSVVTSPSVIEASEIN